MLSAADYLDVVAALDVREDDLLEVVELGDLEQRSHVFGVRCEIFQVDLFDGRSSHLDLQVASGIGAIGRLAKLLLFEDWYSRVHADGVGLMKTRKRRREEGKKKEAVE